MNLSEEDMNRLVEMVSVYGLKIISALVIFVIGKWIAGLIRKALKKGMEKSNVEPVLVGFLGNIAYYGLMVAVVIAAISQIGVQTTSFVAVVGAAGLAVGLALQGSLSNFASGVLIILFRPFKAGDFVVINSESGVIEEIGILVTIMKTPDNKRVIVPNSEIMNNSIVNYSANPTRRVDLVFGIGYSDDIDKAKAILERVVSENELCLKDPAPTFAVGELGDSSVNLLCRPWVNTADYWGVYWSLQENVKKEFDKEGISIPFPQRDVHLFQEKE